MWTHCQTTDKQGEKSKQTPAHCYNIKNKYVGSPYCRAEMYAGRVAFCPLLSHGEYVKGTDRQMDRRKDARSLHYTFRITQLA